MEGNNGRFANIMSFFVKHSLMAEGVDITKTGRHPNQRKNTGRIFRRDCAGHGGRAFSRGENGLKWEF